MRQRLVALLCHASRFGVQAPQIPTAEPQFSTPLAINHSVGSRSSCCMLWHSATSAGCATGISSARMCWPPPGAGSSLLTLPRPTSQLTCRQTTRYVRVQSGFEGGFELEFGDYQAGRYPFTFTTTGGQVPYHTDVSSEPQLPFVLTRIGYVSMSWAQQAEFSFYFDTGGRRRCYIAPERFYPATTESKPVGPLTSEMVRG